VERAPEPTTNDRVSPKRPAVESELGFVRRPMVRWFDPGQLVDTVSRVVLSGVWSSYVDSRELQALVTPTRHDRSEGSELWLDYVSDLGDGWNSTYTVARQLAQTDLELAHDGEHYPTTRGRVLVMGGDQVYPVPKASEYENRLIGPYEAALPCAPDGEPDLLAIPGSHDWYDGLINFTNIFCRGRAIGGWRTSQARSYFALQLPQRWWVWGVDMQFGDYIDEVQAQYFAEVATSHVQPGDSVIICMAKEVESGPKSTEVSSDRDLAYLEREVIEPAGGRVRLYLKSGRHYYSRHAELNGDRQLVTAGGGGAFMHPTHALPERSDPHSGPGTGDYRRAEVYPSAKHSKGLRKRVFLLPAYNLPLAGVFGGVHVVLAFMLNLQLDRRHRGLSFADLGHALWESPSAFLLLLLVVATFGFLVRLAHDANGAMRLVLGLVHSVLLFATVAGVMIVSSKLSAVFENDSLSLLAFTALVAVLGGIGGMFGLAAYLWATNCIGLHGNEAYAPLHHADYKNFLRMHVGADGALTVYPVGIDRVGRKWDLRPDGAEEEPWFAPVGADPVAHLIEAPLRFERRRPPADG